MAVRSEAAAARGEAHERFVAFAFAGAELLAEVEPGGTVVFATGAFRTLFGRPPEAFVGNPVRELAAPSEREMLDGLLALLGERGRLPPTMIRLADTQRTPLAMAGLAMPGRGGSARLCLSFARPPAPAESVEKLGRMDGLVRAAAARLREGTAAEVGLIEVTQPRGMNETSRDVVGQALAQLVPDGTASELTPGRYGVLAPGPDLLSVASMLESVLRTQGVDATVAAQTLPLAAEGLTPMQAARALRQALSAFARNGAEGVAAAGLAEGLAGYMRRAGAQADTLRRAINGGKFALEYQPVVSLLDRGLHHYEALVRPQKLPGSDVEEPQEFVSLVEAVGLAPEFDLAIARTVCATAAQRGVAIAFNLSSQSAQNSACREALIDLLEAAPARKAGLISVELTETAEIEAVDAVCRTGEALRALGVPFCMDDFGAGVADMRMLRVLRADVVKLDGSYVPGVTQGGRERAFVAGMVDVAHAAGAQIVAERIETEQDAEAMRTLGIEYGQGWLFGRPGPLPESLAGSRVGKRSGDRETWA